MGEKLAVTFDELDEIMTLAVVIDALGLDTQSGAQSLSQRGPRSWHFPPCARAALYQAASETASDGWVMLAAVPLCEELLAEFGQEWRPEIEVGVEMALADAAEALPLIAAASEVRDVVSFDGQSARDRCRPYVLTPSLVELIGRD